MTGEQVLDKLIEMSHTAQEICPSCKYLETEFLEKIGWDKWCRLSAD